ncbi:MAG: glycoside hydrolase family 88 protein [Chloroflexota bacterium]
MDLATHKRLTALASTSIDRIADNCSRYGIQFPNHGVGQRYLLKENINWLAGFWPGILWLCASQVEERETSLFTKTAGSLLPSFETRLNQQVHITHDLGFLFMLSARAQWEITQDQEAYQLGLRAADALLARYRPAGQYIQAWGPVGDPKEGGRIIADTMMNLPLLFWASHVTGDGRYRQAAFDHAVNTQAHLIRADGSSYHTFFFDQTTGDPLYAATHQGHHNESLWARGQAWLIYGFALAAHWCDEPRFVTASQKTAARFLAELPADGVPLWDLRLPSDADAPRDSSAAAIAACGLFRLAQLTQESRYLRQAEALLTALIDHCFEFSAEGEGLLKHGALHIPKGWAPDDYLIFGDYFFLEALLTAEGKNPDFWGQTTGISIL